MVSVLSLVLSQGRMLFWLGLSVVLFHVPIYAEKSPQTLVIKGITSPLERSLVVAELSAKAELLGKYLIKQEERGRLVYDWWAEIDSRNLARTLNKDGLLYFRTKSEDKNKVILTIDHELSTPFKKQVTLTRLVSGDLADLVLANNLSFSAYQEQESNNSPFAANRISSDNNLCGVLQSRSDRDFFLSTSQEPRKVWSLLVNRLVNTTFIPVLIVYDANMHKVGEFSLTGKQVAIDVFLLEADTMIYLQITDKIGPMKIETGKILPYKYFVAINQQE